MNNFIFIIPRTPNHFRNGPREILWDLVIKSLQNQKCKNWIAIVIGENISITGNDKRFITIPFEGTKEEKLQKATEYIFQKIIPGDYIIRLDDDDIISPVILEKLSNFQFDLYVDKHQWFWHYESGKISNRIWYWFPNTCIHKREHALTAWGDFANGNFKRFKGQPLLIENDHSKLHPYYKNKNVVFAPKNHPVYLRTITSSSITAHQSQNHMAYLKRFGFWNKNKLEDFQFLKMASLNIDLDIPKYKIYERLSNIWLDFRCSQNYIKNLNRYK